MPILFIAVQCVQCSTMQVKQQKKSSNKWVCAVCNQKQSVLRIHARGFLAREIRNFVQEFNLSRLQLESSGCDPFLPRSDAYLIASEMGSSSSLGVKPARPEKRRTDWSVYLDPEEDDLCVEDGEDPDPEPSTKKLKHHSRKWEAMTKKTPSKNISGSCNVYYEDIFQKSKEECVTIVKESSSKWSEYLSNEEEFGKSFEDDSTNHSPFG